MSNSGSTYAADHARRTLLLRAPAIPDEHDHLLCSAACEAAGFDDAARLLFEMGSIRQGFSPQQRAARAGAANGFWSPESETAAPPSVLRGTVAIALEELAELAQHCPAIPEAPSRQSSHGVGGSSTGTSDCSLAGDTAALIHDLYMFLAGEAPDSGRCSQADELLERLGELIANRPRFDYITFCNSPVPELALALAFAGLQDWYWENWDLIAGSRQSAGFLYRVARFDSAGLGPYFANIRLLARKSRDIFDMAARLTRDSTRRRSGTPEWQYWVVLLSRHLRGTLLAEVIDDLGDLDARQSLRGFHERASTPDWNVDLDTILRLRDTALDNGDHVMAADAQRVVVQARQESVLEHVILASIQASGGDKAAAEATLLECQSMAPADTAIAQRLRALRTGRFEAFAVTRGFGSPADRVETRLRRRQDAPARCSGMPQASDASIPVPSERQSK